MPESQEGAMQTDETTASKRGRPRIVRGVLFAILALSQVFFAYMFGYVVTTVSQTDWWTIHWRWILPWLALASCRLFVRDSWRAFRGEGRRRDA